MVNFISFFCIFNQMNICSTHGLFHDSKYFSTNFNSIPFNFLSEEESFALLYARVAYEPNQSFNCSSMTVTARIHRISRNLLDFFGGHHYIPVLFVSHSSNWYLIFFIIYDNLRSVQNFWSEIFQCILLLELIQSNNPDL